MEEVVEAWVCDQPAAGVTYRVLRDEWIDDYRVRVIHEIAVLDPTLGRKAEQLLTGQEA